MTTLQLLKTNRLAKETIEAAITSIDTILERYSNTMTLQLGYSPNSLASQEARPNRHGRHSALDRELGALAVRSKKRIGRVQARVLHCTPQTGGVLGVPGDPIDQVRMRNTANYPHGAPERGASFLTALVQEVQHSQQCAQSDGRAGKQARQLCKIFFIFINVNIVRINVNEKEINLLPEY
jgi:hypothetical protein